MKPGKIHSYWVYILTNKNRKVLYIGLTNDLARRLREHLENSRTINTTFTGRYNCIYLVYCEWHQYILNAYQREKQLKGWTRKKKEELINSVNPE